MALSSPIGFSTNVCFNLCFIVTGVFFSKKVACGWRGDNEGKERGPKFSLKENIFYFLLTSVYKFVV